MREQIFQIFSQISISTIFNRVCNTFIAPGDINAEFSRFQRFLGVKVGDIKVIA